MFLFLFGIPAFYLRPPRRRRAASERWILSGPWLPGREWRFHSSRGVCRPVNIYPADGSGGDGSLSALRVPGTPPSIGRGFRLDTRPVKLSDNVWDLFESPRGFVGKH